MDSAQSMSSRKPGRPKDPEGLERRRAEILKHAAHVFAKHGFAGTDVQVIADQVGVGKGTIYRHFATKEALFLATVDEGLQDLTSRIDMIFDDTSRDPVEQITESVLEYLRFFHQRPEMVELFIQERAEFGGQHTPRYFIQKSECHTKRDKIFVQALIASGRLRPIDPDQVLTVVGDLLYGTILSNHLSGRPSSPESQAEAILEILLHGVLLNPPVQKISSPSKEPTK